MAVPPSVGVGIGQAAHLVGAPLAMNLGHPNPLARVEFFDTESGICVRG